MAAGPRPGIAIQIEIVVGIVDAPKPAGSGWRGGYGSGYGYGYDYDNDYDNDSENDSDSDNEKRIRGS